MADRVVKVTLRAQVAEYNRGMLEAAQKTRAVGTEAEKLAQKREAFQTLGRGLTLAGAAMTAAVALTVRAAAQWESAWAGVTKTVDGTPEQLAQVESGLRDLTKVLPASHDEIASVAEAAGQLGIQTGNVVAFTKTMIDLGETTNLTANDAATQLARLVNIMGTSQDEVSNLGSALVGLGNNYATTEAEILSMAMRLAGAGRQIGFSEGDVLGLATALSSVGIEAEAGGSAMSKVMIDIAASAEEGGDRIAMFAQVAGMSADEFTKKWRTEPTAALSAFVQGLANAEARGTSAIGVLGELGITEIRMRDALLRSAAAADMFGDAIALGNEEFEKNNALTDEAAKRYETVESKIAIAGNAINDAAISFGQTLLPAVGAAAEAVTGFADFMGGLPGPIQAIITVLAGAVGVIGLVGGAALLAVPQVAQFKVALDTLGWSMRGLSLAGGAVGIALTALVTVVGAVAAAHAQARQRADAYTQALSQGEDAVRDLIVQNLQAEQSFLWMSRGSAFDAAEKLGVSLQTLTDAAAGNSRALDELSVYLKAADGDMDALRQVTDATGLSNVDAANLLDVMVTKLREQSDAQAEAKRLTEQTNEVTEESAGVTQAAADAYLEASGEVGGLNDQLRRLIDTINEANGVGQDAISANLNYKDALAQVDEAIKANEAAWGDGTQAGRDNQQMLVDLAKKAQDAAQAQFDLDGDTEAYRRTLENSRQALIDRAEDLGATKDQAKAFADQIFRIPDETEWKLIAETQAAANKLNTFIRTYDGKVITMQLQANRVVVGNRVYGGLRDGSYQGNLFEGMKPKHFASGGMRSGIYAGVQGGIFAEAERGVPWEAFISGRAADRDRNIGIWMETGRRLGVQSAAGPGAADLAGLVERLAERVTAAVMANPKVTFVNPVQRDPVHDAWEAAQIVGA